VRRGRVAAASRWDAGYSRRPVDHFSKPISVIKTGDDLMLFLNDSRNAKHQAP
jgi:hypothetical protein